MINRKVLLVEDNHYYAIGISGQLDKAGYRVTRCSTADVGLQALQRNQASRKPFVFCIIDAQLKGETDALHFTREARKIAPLIVNTLFNYSLEPVVALQAGVDIIIEQPFCMEQLLRRIQQFESFIAKNESYTISIGNLMFQDGTLLHQDGSVVKKLSPREEQILLFLNNHPNQVVRRENTLMEVWGTHTISATRSMDVLITRLRKCFVGNHTVFLETLHGIGHCLTIHKH